MEKNNLKLFIKNLVALFKEKVSLKRSSDYNSYVMYEYSQYRLSHNLNDEFYYRDPSSDFMLNQYDAVDEDNIKRR